MATLADLENQVRRRMSLESGSHTILCNSANPTDDDTIVVDDTIFTIHTSAQASKASITLHATEATQATNIGTAFTNVLGDRYTNSVDTATVTLTGARTVSATTVNADVFTITTASTEDEPPRTSDIDQWLVDAQNDLMLKLPLDALTSETAGSDNTSLLRSVDITLASAQNFVPLTEAEIVAVGNVFRVVDFEFKADSSVLASDEVEHATRVPYDLLQKIIRGDHPFYKTNTTRAPMGTKWYAVYDNRIYTNCDIETTAGDARLLFVLYATETRTAECDMPEFLQPLMVMYASANGYESLGDTEMSVKLKQEYLGEIQAITQRFSVPGNKVKQEVSL